MRFVGEMVKLALCCLLRCFRLLCCARLLRLLCRLRSLACIAVPELRNEGIAILDEIFATKDFANWRSTLDAAGIILGIVAKMEDIPDDPQILASEALVPFEDGGTMTVNSPIWIKGQEKMKPRCAPAVGEHSDEVLRAAGYSDTHIGALRGEGVIG